jgi:hypothetical protein
LDGEIDTRAPQHLQWTLHVALPPAQFSAPLPIQATQAVVVLGFVPSWYTFQLPVRAVLLLNIDNTKRTGTTINGATKADLDIGIGWEW